MHGSKDLQIHHTTRSKITKLRGIAKKGMLVLDMRHQAAFFHGKPRWNPLLPTWPQVFRLRCCFAAWVCCIHIRTLVQAWVNGVEQRGDSNRHEPGNFLHVLVCAFDLHKKMANMRSQRSRSPLLRLTVYLYCYYGSRYPKNLFQGFWVPNARMVLQMDPLGKVSESRMYVSSSTETFKTLTCNRRFAPVC